MQITKQHNLIPCKYVIVIVLDNVKVALFVQVPYLLPWGVWRV